MFKTTVEVNIGCDDLINELESLGPLEKLWAIWALFDTIDEQGLVECFNFVGHTGSEAFIEQAKNFVELAEKALQEEE